MLSEALLTKTLNTIPIKFCSPADFPSRYQHAESLFQIELWNASLYVYTEEPC